MTAFDSWYNTNVLPTLPTHGLTPEQRELVAGAARSAMAACWNAALDAADKELHSDNPALLRADRMRELKVKLS